MQAAALSTFERKASQARQGRARWTESAEQLELVQEQLLSATLSRLEQEGYYHRHLATQTPLRTSSVRGTSSSRRNKRRTQEQRSLHQSDEHPQTLTEETNF